MDFVVALLRVSTCRFVPGQCAGTAFGAVQGASTRGRACLLSAVAISGVLLCLLGFAGESNATPAPPSVTSVAPSTGPSRGGTNVTITGTNFAGVTAVNFGSVAAASFNVDSPTQITATSPVGTGSVDITVTTPSGTSATGTADQFSYVSTPSVTGVSPNTGPPAGGTSVTITGTNFSGAAAVSFGGKPAGSFTVNSSNQITATSPAGTGIVDITVTTSGGTSALSGADQFSYVAPPTVTGVSPSTGPPAGGTGVTITGTNFAGATAVSFGGRPAGSFTVNSPNQITATSPAGTGIVDVTVTTSGGISAPSGADQFSYVAPPTVTGVSPSTGPPAGGTGVTITGTNFAGATAVSFGGRPAGSFTVNSSNQITATSPAGTGIVDVTVTTSGGTSAPTAADQFSYAAPPTVTGVSPNTGPPAGGTSVTITGTNFTGATAVRFGGGAASSFSVVSATQITAISPAGTGAVDVTVTSPGGTSTTSSADQFSYASGAPTVTSVNANSGPATGGTSVTVRGNNFTGATAVRFGSAPASSFSVVSATQITATSPAGAGVVDVTVTTPNGTSATSAADQFTYASSGPTITSISPNSGPAAGGTSVTITGGNLSGATTVRFGGTGAAAFSVVSPSQITATSPAGIGTVDVTVTTTSGTSAPTAADRFNFIVPGSATTPGGTTTALSSSQNPSNTGQGVRFTATVSGTAPSGTVTFLDGGAQIGSATLAGSTASFTTASLASGSHSITARYSGDSNNAASTSAALLQTVNVPGDSTKLRAMQASVTPIIAQLSGQTMVGAIDNAIDAGFSDNPPPVTPNGGGFTVQIPLDQPAVTALPRIGYPSPGSGQSPPGAVNFPIGSQHSSGPGSLANGRQGGNGAPPGTRLIDLAIMPLPPGSGMPPIGETRFVPNEVVVQFAARTPPQQIADFARRFGLTLEAQETVDALRRAVYIFRIANGQSVRQVIHAIETERTHAFVQPNYTYGLAQERSSSNSHEGDPAQYDVNKLHLAEAHEITRGDKVVIAVIDSEIDFNQPNLAGAIADRYDAGCGASAPDSHGTGMAGAIASHGGLLGVAPRATLIAICAFGGKGQPQSTVVRIIQGLNYAIQHGARIVNMSFAGPRDPSLSQMLQIAREKGVLVIAAAGNAGPKSPPLYPGADPNAMAVTATDEHDKLFKGANQGDYVTLAAPGVNVLVPAPGADVQFTTGTSVATANVSGVAALLIAHNPLLTPEDVRALLVKTAKHLGPRGVNRQFGAGLVDPLKALEARVSQVPALLPSAGQNMQQSSLNAFFASPDGNRRRVADGFSALGYASEGTLRTKAPPTSVTPHRWLAWIDVSGANFDRTTVGSDLKGVQVDTIAGITHRVTSDFLVGVLGGYEHFDYSSQAFNGVLRGDGWTTGAYLGWRLFQNLQFDAGGAWSNILTSDTSGMASGDFLGHRWLVTGGITGTYNWQTVVFEPSARVYALWEHENAYTDSLGTLQPDRNFATGRASAGIKVTYPFTWSNTINFAPYLGLYGDYYFSMDDGTIVGLTTVPLLQGWSARATGGVAMTFSNSAQLNLGAEYGGIGSDTHIWTWRMRGSVPF